MSDTNDKSQSKEPLTVSHSRRQFIVSATTAVAGVGAANLLNLPTANAANLKNAAAIGDGPYRVEGMAAYSPTGPHKLMKFQRRALGPKTLLLRFTIPESATLTSIRFVEIGVRSNIRKLLAMS
ncbi:MAG: ubiquinol-cytochrome c reductase iron-sulfur subunit N-terminal domain-containing protein [Methylococcales bacterium]|nr:ubiquinol-cytochrome c reductase iron-sulfur subunit N-terminal domain-containing protein [Methylococcales bacterium]